MRSMKPQSTSKSPQSSSRRKNNFVSRTYWYFFYTIFYSPSTYTTRYRTTVTKTTAVTCEVTDYADALSTFSSVSSELPTPSDAQVTIPATPTAGALVIGSCVTTTVLGSSTDVCETEVASVEASQASSSSGGTSGSSGPTSNAGQSSLQWLGLCSVASLLGGLMVLL